MINFGKNIIISEAEFGSQQQQRAGEIYTVAYGTDNKFMIGCAISITSIIKKNAKLNFSFHIFTDNISKDYLAKFNQLAEISGNKITIHILNASSLTNLPVNKLWSTAIYYRFIIADYFLNIADNVLYVDSDIICNGDLTLLLKKDINEYLCAAVAERGNSWWQERSQKLHVPELTTGYFNSGVMLINTKRWSAHNITSTAFTALSDSNITERLTYYDQDILNIICAGQVLFLDDVYNVQYSINYELQGIRDNPANELSVLMHYIGPTKPWHHWARYPCSKYFLDAKNTSLWANEKLMKPSNTSQWRYAAKHYFKQGMYIRFLSNYIYYFWFKIF